MTRIVVIEDEPDIAEVIRYNLIREGFEVLCSDRGDTGINQVRHEQPSLVILDLMLPGLDGLSVCRQLKADPVTSGIPVIIVSAKGEESDVVIGLELGADDYVPKPFSPRELLARVRAVLRRVPAKSDRSASRLAVGDLLMDVDRHEVRIAGESVRFTATEFRILSQLMAQPGRVFTREQLLNHAVGDGVVVVDRNIDVHIRAIRKKLGTRQEMIQTIRGVGYRLRDG